jgi:D-mannonate dehydratase
MKEGNCSLTYKNKKYGFTLSIPRWWKHHCFLDAVNFMKDVESTINFNLKYSRKYDRKGCSNIVSILVFKMSKTKWQSEYDGSPIQYITSRYGRVFAYVTPSEPPEEFLKKDKRDYDRTIKEFKMLTRMVNHDVPRIIKSFKFLV